MIHGPIDLRHMGAERVIGVYVVETDAGPALFDCGPATTFERLQQALLEHGLALSDLRNLLLSHIHLDHAGAAGHLVREHPSLNVHVSEIGAPHLHDPSRLISSARRIYGDTLDELYGEPLPIPHHNLNAVGDHAAGLACFPTPGHASHHVCYIDDDGTLYAGDATGVRIMPSTHVLPHAPPPDLDLEAWERTFDDVLRHQPERLALIHYGIVDGLEEVAEHVERTRTYLEIWGERVRDGMTKEEFVAAAKADLEAAPDADAPYYERAAPLEQSYLGLERYWRKRREREAAA